MSESPKIDRRHSTRIGFEATVILNQGNREFSAPLVDISVKGVLLEKPREYQTNSTAPVSLNIALANELCINMKVELIHSSDTLLGFKCESIDMDSLCHLRRLIELNMDDVNAAERVLSELINPID